METLAWAATLRMSIFGVFEDLLAVAVPVRAVAARMGAGLVAGWGLRDFFETLFKLASFDSVLCVYSFAMSHSKAIDICSDVSLLYPLRSKRLQLRL